MTSCESTSLKREEPGNKVEIKVPLAIDNFENERKVKEIVTLRKLSLPLQIAAIVSNAPKAQRIYVKRTELFSTTHAILQNHGFLVC